MKIAHLSDLHVLGDDDVPAWRYLNKRLTGWANLRFRRHAVHKREIVRLLARELRAHAIDHVVVTGDLSNLALEGELEAARRLLEDDLHLTPDHVSLVPGNHDVYTVGSAWKKSFARAFAAYLTSDIPGLAVDLPAGPFPYVRLRGPAAIIGLASAVPRPPFFASGKLGRAQLEALRRALAHDEVKRRFPIVLLHHPPHNPPKLLRTATNGLYDARALRDVLALAPRSLVLHGHLHERQHVRDAAFDAVGATSSSLISDADARMAGFNVYEISDAGALSKPRAHVLDVGSSRFREIDVPLTMR